MTEYFLILALVSLGGVMAVRHLGQVTRQQTGKMAQELAGVNTGTNGVPGGGGTGTGGSLPGSHWNDGGGSTGGGSSGDAGNGGSTGDNGGAGPGGGNGGEPTDGGGDPSGDGGNPGGASGDDSLKCLKATTKKDNKDNQIDAQKSAFDAFKRYEDDWPKMYFDSVGQTTVGIGNALIGDKDEAEKQAEKLDFYIKVTNPETGKVTERLATDAEIDAAIDVIFDHPQSQECLDGDMTECLTAGYYNGLEGNNVYRHEKDRVAHAKKGIKDFGDKLRDVYTDFDTYPDKVKLALYDMIYNLGKSGIENTFKSFTKAIRDRNWEDAAKESYRQDVNSTRNAYVKGLLEDAEEAKKLKVAACATNIRP